MNAEREVVDMKVIKNLISKYALMLAVPILLFVVLSIIFHGVIGTNNIPSLMQQAVAPAILGWGVLFNIKVGNWDFSVGSVVLLSAIIGGNIAVRLNWGFAGLLIFCLLVAVLAGVVVGLVYYFLKIPTIITSIGMLLIYESISSYAFEGQGIYLTGWNLLGNTEIVIIAIVAAATAYLIFYRSSIGYNVRAVGNNMNIAAQNGLNVYRVKAVAIAIAGLFAGLYAFISLGTSGVQKTVSSMGTMGTCFDAMMCVFVGMSITRRGNLVAGIFCGSLVMQLVKLALMAIGIPSEYNSIFIAIFVLIFMTMDAYTNNRAPRRKKETAEAAKA
jgi:ribose/xylose/arabinose/galactoside ABC-type transport system permease subunit